MSERTEILAALEADRVFALEGGETVSRDAWARIDHLLDMLNVVDVFPLVDEGVQT